MSQNDELHRILSDTQRFLKQQQELYGETIFLQEPGQSVQEPEREILLAQPDTDPVYVPPVNTTTAFQQTIGEPILPSSSKIPWTSAQSLDELNGMIHTCKQCGLGKTRIKFVFGVGNPNADVVVVGEAPGADEDEQGEPFVGRAGQLLTKILEAVHFKRDEVYICNMLKCRPPNNRDPQAEEVDCCEPYLWKQLELIQPKLILCVGRIAGQSLLKTNSSLTLLRGKFHDYRGIPLMVTYHPAALLRNPNWKRPCWEDMQQFRKMYDDIKAKQ
jgi:uracil-DNA glycosylase